MVLYEMLSGEKLFAGETVSLTLAHVTPPTPTAPPTQGLFQVVLIPTTLEKTTLAHWTRGTRINIEADSMAKTIVNYLEHFAPGMNYTA